MVYHIFGVNLKLGRARVLAVGPATIEGTYPVDGTMSRTCHLLAFAAGLTQAPLIIKAGEPADPY